MTLNGVMAVSLRYLTKIRSFGGQLQRSVFYTNFVCYRNVAPKSTFQQYLIHDRRNAFFSHFCSKADPRLSSLLHNVAKRHVVIPLPRFVLFLTTHGALPNAYNNNNNNSCPLARQRYLWIRRKR